MRFPAYPIAVLSWLRRVESFRDRRRDVPGWLVAGGLLLLVFLDGMAYVTARQYSARGTVAGLVSGANSQGNEVGLEETIIRELDVPEGRAAYIVRVHNVNDSPASGLVLVVDCRKHALPLVHGTHQEASCPALGDQEDVQTLEHGDGIITRGRLQRLLYSPDCSSETEETSRTISRLVA